MDNSKKTFRQLRRDRDLSQEQVANYLGISINNYAAKEQGKRGFLFTEVIRFSELVKVNIDEIQPINSKNTDK